jgi:hypothetical protein
MVLAFGSRQNLLDIVEAAYQTLSKIESFRPEWCQRAWPGSLECLKAGAKHVVHDCLERGAPLQAFAFQPCGHVIIEGDGRSHDMMLPQRCFDVTKLMLSSLSTSWVLNTAERFERNSRSFRIGAYARNFM